MISMVKPDTTLLQEHNEPSLTAASGALQTLFDFTYSNALVT